MNTSTTRGAVSKIVIGCLAVGAVILVIAVIFLRWAIGINNNLAQLNQGADAAWAQVQSVYQRRLDLIPNLVATVKGAASHELDLQIGVIQQRANATKIQINPSDPEQFKAFAENQNQLKSSLSRLLVTVENYPQVKANENFLSLQAQIEGTENRITVERQNFNKAVQAFNNAVVVFPASVIAGFRNMKVRPYFAADVAAETAPTVDFTKPTPAPAAGAAPAAPAPMPAAATPQTSPSASLLSRNDLLPAA